uniref:Ig-like domain-containing protein n=1 Tax=Scleropages formosus TaxID=113540 RepID=A0A8C9RTD4_SCLFO
IWLRLCGVCVFLFVRSQQIIADPEVTAYLGGDVTLHCRLQSKSTVKITQVQWTWESTEKKKEVIVVYNPAHGKHYFNSTFSGRVVYTNQSLGHVSIYITGVKLTDKGKFTCQYTTFPNGIMKTTSTLIRCTSQQKYNLCITLRERDIAADM